MPNTAPIAVNDTIDTTEDSGPITITALANDTDADGDVLSLISVTTPSAQGASVTYVGGNLIYTPAPSLQNLAAGETLSDTFTYVIQDPSAAQSTGTVTVTITGVNDVPTVGTALNNQLLYRGTNFSYTLPIGSLVDLDTNDGLTYTPLLSDGSALPDWLGFDPTSRTFSGTPPNNIQAPLDITIALSDLSTASASTSFTITPTNSAPTLNTSIDPQTATEKTQFTFTVPAETFIDADGDLIIYSAKLTSDSPLPNWLTFSPNTRVFSGKPGAGTTGEISVRITATDTSLTAAYSDFTIIIDNTNDVPTLANKLEKQTWKALETSSFVIPSNTFEDIDPGDALTLSAKGSFKAELPAWLTFDGDRTITGTPDNTNAGINSVLITATDLADASVVSFLKIVVQYTNQAPVTLNSITDQTAKEGEKISFSIPKRTFQDPDKGDVLTLSAENLPEGLSFNARKGVISGIPAHSSSGDYTVNLTATDKAGLSVQTSFMLSVQDNPLIIGTSSADWLVGDSGDNLLYGKAGVDTLTGGEGADMFIFDTKPGRKNIDTITDFQASAEGPIDGIMLSKKVFTAYKMAGVDLAEDFVIGSSALDASDHFLYNSSIGILSYDPDGSGPKQATDIATLSGLPTLTAAALQII